jgi:cytochrome c5/mono/diheme cytochrome c family protein
MKKSASATLIVAVCMAAVWTAAFLAPHAEERDGHDDRSFDKTISKNAKDLFSHGRETFRYDTFGDEHFWGDTLKLHQAIEGARFGGVGGGITPATALSLGLKVDVDALPATLVDAIRAGAVDLNDPANTLALLRLNAVLGIVPIGSNATGGMQSMGVTCALCHSNVDNSFAPGIGHRLDGWANRDLNVGAIIAAAPDLSTVAALLQVDQATVRAVANSWGPGRFDAELFLDGKPFRPDGKTAATLIPPAFGLAGMNQHTYTGWGSVPYWNAFVANLEMHGSGTFFDPRLDDAAKFPVAARAGMGHTRADEDKVTAKLAQLQFYQLAIPAPAAPEGTFDRRAAVRGQTLFNARANCSSCHVAPLFSEPGWAMHKGAEIGIDDFQASRSPDGMYRTTPLKGAWSHAKGGYYHDGRFATLLEVVKHYDETFSLHLSAAEMNDLVEYLKSL